MKVLHLLQSSHFSGAENVVCQIIGMFRENSGVEMAYCSQDGQIREALLERGIPFFPLNGLAVSEVKRVLREYKPDVIHAHDFNAAFHAALACGTIPLITHVHNNDTRARKITVKSLASLIPMIKSRHIFWVSQSALLQYRFRSVVRKKSEVLQNIIDMDALYEKMELDTEAYDFDVVYVGRLTYPKNPERLIRVIGKAVATNPDLKIAVIGTGDLEAGTKALSESMGLNANVTFLGFCPNPLKIMYDAKAMLMTSRYEGTPMCALEAQSLGLPIVSTPTDGLSEIITDGENGFLSEEDDILAGKLCELVASSGLRSKMSASAKAAMDKMMNKKNYVASIEKAYKKAQG